jgi:hypothetical protein
VAMTAGGSDTDIRVTATGVRFYTYLLHSTRTDIHVGQAGMGSNGWWDRPLSHLYPV